MTKIFIFCLLSTNHHVDHIIERTDMPDELVRSVKGETIFEQVMGQVRILYHNIGLSYYYDYLYLYILRYPTYFCPLHDVKIPDILASANSYVFFCF